MSKRFSYLIMNPPYNGKLHLRILEKAIQIADNILSIQPVDTFVNMNISDKKSKEIAKHIESLEKVSNTDANNIFNILSSSNLGIIYAKNTGAIGYTYDNQEIEHIIQKIRKQKSIRSSITCHKGNPKTEYYISILGDYGYAKSWHYSLEDIFNGQNVNAKIEFNTQQELDNFINSVKLCWPYKLMYIIDDNAAVIAHLPYMDDYTEEWTDKRFFEYFNISEKEQNLIKQIIKEKQS